MLIGESGAVSDLWEAARKKLPRPRLDRPGQPVFAITDPPPAGGTGLRPATLADLDLLVPSCAAAHHEELGVDPLRRDPSGFRWRTRAQIEEGRSWLWAEGGVIRFKAEASAWTPAAVQLQQVWTDPPARRQGFAGRALRDLIRLLLAGHSDRLPVRAGGERTGDQAVRVGRDAPRAGLPIRAAVTPVLREHADPGAPRARRLERGRRRQRRSPGRGSLGGRPRGGARTRPRSRAEPIELGVSSRLRRAHDTLALALAGRGTPCLVEPRLDEIGFGSFEGGSLPDYRAWAWANERGRRLPGRRREPRRCRGSPRRRARGIAGTARASRAGRQPRASRPVRDRCRSRPRPVAAPRARAARDGLPARAAGRRAGRCDAQGVGAPSRSLRMPRLVDDGADRAPPMHTSSMIALRPRALLAALVALLAVAAAGCGGSTVAVPELTSLTSVAQKSSAADSAKFDLKVELTLPGTDKALSLGVDGGFDTPAKRSHLTADLSSLAELFASLGSSFGGTVKGDLGSPEDWKLEAIQDGDTVYIRFPLMAKDLPDGKTWIKGDAEDLSRANGGQMSQFGSFAGTDARDVFGLLKAVSGSIEAVGSEEIRGVETSHYRATIDTVQARAARPRGATTEPRWRRSGGQAGGADGAPARRLDRRRAAYPEALDRSRREAARHRRIGQGIARRRAVRLRHPARRRAAAGRPGRRRGDAEEDAVGPTGASVTLGV